MGLLDKERILEIENGSVRWSDSGVQISVELDKIKSIEYVWNMAVGFSHFVEIGTVLGASYKIDGGMRDLETSLNSLSELLPNYPSRVVLDALIDENDISDRVEIWVKGSA